MSTQGEEEEEEEEDARKARKAAFDSKTYCIGVFGSI